MAAKRPGGRILRAARAPLWRVAAVALALALASAASSWAGEPYRLYVDGLACPFCAYGVEKKLGGLDGVDKVEIDIDGGLVAVTMTGGARLEEAAARRAIDQAGFSLRAFEAPDTD